ncbi:MAG: hypothetical protein AB7M12_00230 [Hyphomonadaceae bacterium]
MRRGAQAFAALCAWALSLLATPAWADDQAAREQPLTLVSAIERIDPPPVRGDGLLPRLRLTHGVEAAAGTVRSSAALALRLSSRVELYAEGVPAAAFGEAARAEPAIVNGRIGWRLGGVTLALESVNLFDTEDRNLAYLYATRAAGEARGEPVAMAARSFRVQAKLRF